MTALPHDPPSLLTYLDQQKIRYYKVGVFDIDGVLRGKYLHRAKLESALEKGFGFCDVVLGWDSADQLYDNTQLSGWHTGYKDATVRLAPSTVRRLPGEPDTALILGYFDDEYASACPRGLLSRCAQFAESLGFRCHASAEYEFFLFQETPQSARAKGYRNLVPMTPGMFGYSVLRNSVHDELYRELLDDCETLRCPIEGLHTETGPGVLEAALRYDEICEAGDKAALFKTFMKIFAQRRELMATFMAKWSNQYPGQSGHIHISLQDIESQSSAFHDPTDPDGLSQTMRYFIEGQVQLMPTLLPMVCATVNSYRRLVPGMWAPTHANWGIENRTTAIRVIRGGASSTRSEYRVAPADANPYLALSCALASGLWGIREGRAGRLTPRAPITGNGYENPGPKTVSLPRTLGAATQVMSKSEVARELFGDTFVDHFCATREWEQRQSDPVVTQWDLERYFEII